MTSNASQAKPAPKARRVRLNDMGAGSQTPPPVAGAVVEQAASARPSPAPAAVAPIPRTAKYPSTTVYLPPRALRLLKEIGLEDNRRMTDIMAEALNDWLIKKGHPSLEQLGQ